jgi:PAS domain S-box-containing protein
VTKRRTVATPRASIRNRVITLLIAYASVTFVVLAILMLYLRSEAITSGQKVLGGFAELANEQTARTLQNVDQTLGAAELILSTAAKAGAADEDEVRSQFRDLLKDRPFLTSINAIDRQGRIVYGREAADTGRDVSDRDYFVNQRDKPGASLLWGTPRKARSTGQWVITATLPIPGPNGEFGGLIVGFVPLAFFDNVWKVDDDVHGLAITLWRDDGVPLMRSPFDTRIADGTLQGAGKALFSRIHEGQKKGQFETVSLIDGVRRIVVFRRLDAYPNFILSFTQSIDQALVAWWRSVWIAVAGWAVATATVGALGLRVAREWNARRAMENRNGILFDTNPAPMVIVDRETENFLAVNDAAVKQYGWSRDELLAMTINDLYRPQDVPAISASRQAIERNTERRTPDLLHRTKSGAVISIEKHMRPIDFEGRPALLATLRDVSTDKAAEGHLAQAKEQYHALLEAAPDAMVVVDQSGKIVLVNVQAEKQFGYRRDELLGQPVTNIIPEGFAERLVTDATRSESDALAQEIGTGIELSGRRKDGSAFPIEIMLSPLAAAEGILVTAAIRNISVRKAAEEQLRQSLKMEAVGQLTGGLAHDFNNILFVILANTDALLEDESFDPGVVDRLGQIDKAVQRAADLTRQLLAFSRKQPLRPQQTDLNDLVNDTGQLLRRSLGTEIEIEAVLADDLFAVSVDRSQFETALVNLCINARDAMPSGGRLLIETKNVVLDEEYCAFNRGAIPGDYAMLCVTDAGEGIPQDVLHRVFEPFFTTKGIGKGTGLGLSMVYGFIKQSNGHISIYSELGQGTTLKLFLPRSDGVPEQEAKQEKTAVPGGHERILVVEDEPQVRANIVRQLRSLGYAVSEAFDGAAGLASFEAASPQYDLLLSDVVMPGAIGGKHLGAEVLRRWPGTKVVFMSGFTEISGVRHGQLAESALLLSKPFRKADLARMIRHALDTADQPVDVPVLSK